jgi:hypothetical protein
VPVEVRQRLLEVIYAGQPFRTVLRNLGLSSNRVFWLARIDEGWSEKLETALTVGRRDDLVHGTNAAYIHGCVCSECRAHQQLRMGRNRNSGRSPWTQSCELNPAPARERESPESHEGFHIQ